MTIAKHAVTSYYNEVLGLPWNSTDMSWKILLNATILNLTVYFKIHNIYL
jgi:hypothetical protein